MLKSVKDLLPNTPQKEAAVKKISEAETAFTIAEAKAAQELGYDLCRCSWPPQIMLVETQSGHISCPKCGKKDVGSTIRQLPFDSNQATTMPSGDELTEIARVSGFSVSSSYYSDGKEGNLGLYQRWLAKF